MSTSPPPISKYGLRFPAAQFKDERLIELAMYSSEALRLRGNPLTRWEHLRNCIKGFLPDEVFRWHRWVDEFGEAWCEHSQVNVWGAGGTTKSGIVGCLALFDLMADPHNTLTVMVTNPLEKHADRCYSKTLYWKAHMPEPWKSMWKIVASPKPSILTKDLKEGSRTGILCISVDKGESADDIAKKVGAHAPRTRLIFDEGQGLPEESLNIGTNLFLGSKSKKCVVIGNPTSWRGNALGAASKPADGDTRKIDDAKPDSWLSKMSWDEGYGKTIVFDGLRSPSLDSPEESKRLFFMPQQSDIDARRRLPGGENTPAFWSQVRGRVPPSGSVFTVFSELDWDTLNIGQIHPFSGTPEYYIGMDQSLGGDKIPVYKFAVGLSPGRSVIAQKTAREYITVPVTEPDKSGYIAKQFVSLIQPGTPFGGPNGIQLSKCALDCSGQQGAIADTIERMVNGLHGNQRVVRIKTEEAVTERVLSGGRVKDIEGGGTRRETAKDRYKDRATEVIMNIVELIQAGMIWGLDDEVRMQLTTRGFDQASLDLGKTKVQKKKEWREGHGGQSPDELDAVACFVAMALEKKILVPGVDKTPVPDKYPGMAVWQRPDAKIGGKLKSKHSRVSFVMRGKR